VSAGYISPNTRKSTPANGHVSRVSVGYSTPNTSEYGQAESFPGYSSLEEILHNFTDNHVILLAETWLRDTDITHLRHADYYIYYQNRAIVRRRARRAAGGLLCLIRKDISGVVTLDRSNEDIMWIKFPEEYSKDRNAICLGLVYFSPENATRHTQAEPDVFRALELQIMDLLVQDIIVWSWEILMLALNLFLLTDIFGCRMIILQTLMKCHRATHRIKLPMVVCCWNCVNQHL
jgi:hypothetical protein